MFSNAYILIRCVVATLPHPISGPRKGRPVFFTTQQSKIPTWLVCMTPISVPRSCCTSVQTLGSHCTSLLAALFSKSAQSRQRTVRLFRPPPGLELSSFLMCERKTKFFPGNFLVSSLWRMAELRPSVKLGSLLTEVPYQSPG